MGGTGLPSHMEKLELETRETSILNAVLEQGKATAKSVSKQVGLPLSKVYPIINSMIERGIVSKSDEKPSYLYVANSSTPVVSLLKEARKKQENYPSVVGGAGSTLDSFLANPSKTFEIGTSMEENRKIQSRTFQEAKSEVCQILNIHHNPLSNRVNKTQWEWEISEAIKRGVTFRVIYPTESEIPPILEKLAKDKFIIRRLNTDFIRCDIIDRKKIVIKFAHETHVSCTGIVFIENEKLARCLQQAFEMFWIQAK